MSGFQSVQANQIVKDRKWKLTNAIDRYDENNSWVHVSQMLGSGIASVFSGAKKYHEEDIPSDLACQSSNRKKKRMEVSKKFFNWVQELLEQEKYEGHPFEVIPGGLNGIAEGLADSFGFALPVL
ncbi:uncharacterized protein Z518_04407 [Rhinocladiella mackenziei CBS 650.93]|uniref:Rhinocladiella mackenziei CBS 650.93 unplaced genomic scaffold supercont1.3, whole genome shotgun sequence n=1 Tax=Rhinocladiella mackenziei CBS 650.93 TaxID=1442369 RepID=A0A0D2ITE1_9EURO|nr:uncharacterized protein Z518_04407 [Rhinocladiella mackenziei CBS 650.93]KIX06431.1 hypothetical protein Z518_04407 [Rhinocladiella mackenziei CBS 650.93]